MWPASTTRKEWFAITSGVIQQTIAEMDLDPAKNLTTTNKDHHVASADNKSFCGLVHALSVALTLQ